jgi:hypothetical protein
MSYDVTDNIVMNGILDTEPFPVTYRPTSKTAPDFTGVESGEPKLLASNTEHVLYEGVQSIRAFIAKSNNKQVATIEGM